MLPDLGEGLQEAEIVAWHVAEGDHVVADQPLVSVETDKAVVEVPAPQSGRIARLIGKPGDRVKVGTPLVMFEEGAHPDTGTVVGELGAKPPEVAPVVAAAPSAARPVTASPAVRALARERSVDLAQISGTGPDGAITREDVERAASSPGSAIAGAPLTGVRRTMAVNMARAHAEVVPATLWDDADVEAWWAATADVSVRLVRAIASACAAVPALNVRYDGKSMRRELRSRIDLGIAVDTEDGLLVPVLRDVGHSRPGDLRQKLDELKAAARARRLAPADLRDPTITLSNFGTIGGRQAALVILPPQVAIIGAGRISAQAVPRNGSVAFRHILPLSLTFDHRAVTGGEAARFLAAMIDDLGQSAPQAGG
ncbi:MAG TPA: dihydrolipoamide acetyltransferase family protein [Stellaceae bacterium]|nr:dihydrolipoamide acetyltransferase family protein [Stellaceae bacterium]